MQLLHRIYSSCKAAKMVSSEFDCTLCVYKSVCLWGVSIHWTGLLDWTTGLRNERSRVKPRPLAHAHNCAPGERV